LLNYVEQESKRGVPEYMVKKALRDAGWSDAQINEAFAAVQSKVTPPAPGLSPKDEDAFAAGDDLIEESSKKSMKPIIAAISVFAILAITVGGLILYYNYSSSPREAENTVPANESAAETPAEEESGSSVVETPAAGQDDAGQGGADVANATTTAAVVADSAATEAVARDNRRIADMQELSAAQKTWYAVGNRYYTCGLAGGDCKGKLYGYPLQIGTALAKTPQDPKAAQYGSKKLACGKDYVYCGLNNAPYPQFFCYYAKLEAGGYYTASHEGNFKRSTPPKIFEECAVAN